MTMYGSYRRTPAQWWARFGLALGVWTLFGLFEAFLSHVHYNYLGHPIPWGQALGLGLGLWYGWGLLSPAIFWLARRYPLEGRNWLRRLALHLAAGAGVVL